MLADWLEAEQRTDEAKKIRVSKKGSGTNSRNGPSGASHYWFLTPFSKDTSMLKML